MNETIRIGLLRLVDNAPVIVAEADGLFAEHGLDARISIEPSWANVADKLAYGLLDAAVMLPPLALAACAGLRGPKSRLVVPLSLTQGGNAITVRTDVAEALVNPDEPARLRLLEWLRTQARPPRFAVVHTFSTHNLLMRYWLASGGADPDRDIETVVIPPGDVVAALATGDIAGFCAGAPWGEVAERVQSGRVLLGTSTIWPFHPEKCLCMREEWAEANPDLVTRMLQALLRAQMRCDRPEEAASIANLLSDPKGLALPLEAALAALPGGHAAEQIRFYSRSAWFPVRAHAGWFIGQMQRWGWMPEDMDVQALARQVYRPDLLAPALHAEGLYTAGELPELETSALLPMPGDEAFAPPSIRR